MPELPVPSLADDVVRLRPWREADVPAQLAAFSDPCFLRFSDWAPQTEADAVGYWLAPQLAERCGFTREGILRSHVPFKGARRDSLIFSLLPGELR